MAHSQFSQPDGLCLRFPHTIGPQRELTPEAAAGFLTKAFGSAQTTPFIWGHLDKPQDEAVYLLFLPQGIPFPIDGVRYQETEMSTLIPVSGGRELEYSEIKYGFIPGAGEPAATRVRRRYRLTKGGHKQLVLVHYVRGHPAPINQGIMNQPVRSYPLRVVNDPPVYVVGEKQGQKAFPPGMHPAASAGPPMVPGMMGPNMSFSQQQAMLAQQNSQMEAMERRRENERRERERAAAAQGRGGPQRMPEMDDSDDEIEQISTRTLAMARYKRNHDWMNEVFHQAAFKTRAKETASPYSIFPKDELDKKVAKLQEDIEALQSMAAKRRADKIRAAQNQETGDVSMESATEQS